MAVALYSLLLALSWRRRKSGGASLGFVDLCGQRRGRHKIFLHERVDRRRWMAALFVAAGVALLAA